MFKDKSLSEKSLLKLTRSVPFLGKVIAKLNHNNIRYGIYSGSFAAIASDYRHTNDIDIVVHDEDILTVKRLFPFARTKDIGCAVFLYIGENDEIEIVAQSDVQIGEHIYKFRLTELAWKHSRRLVVGDLEVSVLNPIDTILMKSVLQRGQEQNKFDLEDIEQIIQFAEINKKYLLARLQEINADSRVFTLLHKYNLVLKDY